MYICLYVQCTWYMVYRLRISPSWCFRFPSGIRRIHRRSSAARRPRDVWALWTCPWDSGGSFWAGFCSGWLVWILKHFLVWFGLLVCGLFGLVCWIFCLDLKNGSIHSDSKYWPQISTDHMGLPDLCRIPRPIKQQVWFMYVKTQKATLGGLLIIHFLSIVNVTLSKIREDFCNNAILI